LSLPIYMRHENDAYEEIERQVNTTVATHRNILQY
jgi:hypothetical protein